VPVDTRIPLYPWLIGCQSDCPAVDSGVTVDISRQPSALEVFTEHVGGKGFHC
jgi:hypothetical protein